MLPDRLYHYYDCRRRPFSNLSDLPPGEAEAVLNEIRRAGLGFASRRAEDYLTIRRALETYVRARFIDKGGAPVRARPHYMILGRCEWVKSWYAEGCELSLALACFDPQHVSFTYGDTFPAMRFSDGKPYRRQVYTLFELPEVIERYGLPQDWNPNGAGGPDRYIEAQVWSDDPLRDWLA